MDLEKELGLYDYEFPDELIAQSPATPRDSAKLLAYDRRKDEIQHLTFRELPRLLPEGAVLVLNETKVIPARLELKKDTGGKVKILFLGWDQKNIRALCEKKLRGESDLLLGNLKVLKVSKKEGKEFILRPLIPKKKLEEIFEKKGEAPIPPYIKHSPLSGRKLIAEYQTVFAKKKGSVAAPTASLHFTPRLINALKKKGIEIRFVTLHVGLGTFAPLTEENLKKRSLHSEHYEVPKETVKAIAKAKKEKRLVVAVGTTVIRTLESWAKSGKETGDTKLFIQPGYKFKIVDSLITNFHVPRSSLMMLISAFLGREKLLILYKEAVQKKYRLFSFGDGMIVK